MEQLATFTKHAPLVLYFRLMALLVAGRVEVEPLSLRKATSSLQMTKPFQHTPVALTYTTMQKCDKVRSPPPITSPFKTQNDGQISLSSYHVLGTSPKIEP